MFQLTFRGINYAPEGLIMYYAHIKLLIVSALKLNETSSLWKSIKVANDKIYKNALSERKGAVYTWRHQCKDENIWFIFVLV